MVGVIFWNVFGVILIIAVTGEVLVIGVIFWNVFRRRGRERSARERSREKCS